MATPAPLFESTESASPIVTRAVEAGLKNRYYSTYQFSRWEKAALYLLGLFPQSLSKGVLTRLQAFTALDPALLKGLSVETLAQQRLNDYLDLRGTYPSVLVGAALGGAASNLALTLKGPFLPQAFVMTLKGGSLDGNPTTYFHRSAGLALEIARLNPNIVTIQHFDPIHDGWVTHWANHLRIKLVGLPDAYVDFLRQRLQPGGTVCYLDSEVTWPRYRVGERSIFQVGGWGGILPEEFLEGSSRLEAFCQSEGYSSCKWSLPGYPLEIGRESEWGSEPGLGEALEAFCREEGFQFTRISLPGPFDFSRLAFFSTYRLIREGGLQPNGVLIEMFSQFDSTAVRRGGLLPLWLVFNTRDSLEFLQEMREYFPEGKPVFFSPSVTFSITPDRVLWSEWEEALKSFNWRNIGTRPSHYPADTQTLIHWNKPLHDWVNEHPSPIRGWLTGKQLQELASNIMASGSML